MKSVECAKVRYSTRVAAQKAVRALGYHGAEAYRCKACDGWHIGHSHWRPEKRW